MKISPKSSEQIQLLILNHPRALFQISEPSIL